MAGRRRSLVAVACVGAALYAAAGCAWSLEGLSGGPESDGAPSADGAVEAEADAEAKAEAGVADAGAAPAAFLSIDPPLNAAGGTYDLTALGGLDWEQWTLSQVIRCAPCAPRIGMLATTAQLNRYTDDPRSFAWTNGTPVASGSLTEGIFIEGVGQQFQLPVDTAPARGVLTVHADTYYAAAAFSAQIDGVGLGVQKVVVPPLDGPVLYAFKVHFYAPAGSSLRVTWTMTTDLLAAMPDAGDVGNIAVIAATLAPDP